MLTLLFDTSSEKGILALFREKEVLAFEEVPIGQQLVARIDCILKNLNIQPRELGRIVCGKGPGSYTGLRIAASVGKALAFALGIPLIGVSALMCYGGPAVIDARMGGLYVSVDGPRLISKEEPFPDNCFTPSAIRLKEVFPHKEWIERAPDPHLMLELSLQEEQPFALLYLQEWQAQRA